MEGLDLFGLDDRGQLYWDGEREVKTNRARSASRLAFALSTAS